MYGAAWPEDVWTGAWPGDVWTGAAWPEDSEKSGEPAAPVPKVDTAHWTMSLAHSMPWPGVAP